MDGKAISEGHRGTLWRVRYAANEGYVARCLRIGTSQAGCLHGREELAQAAARFFAARDIERMTYEFWRFWEAKTLPMQYIYAMNVEKQHRLRTAMRWRLKKLLRERVEKETGKEPHFPDGASYWRLKERFYRDGQFHAPDRKPDRGAGPGAVGEGR